MVVGAIYKGFTHSNGRSVRRAFIDIDKQREQNVKPGIGGDDKVRRAGCQSL